MLERLKAWIKRHRILFFIAKSIKRPFEFPYMIGSTSFLVTHCRAFTQNVYIRNALIWISSPFSAIRYLLTFDWTNRTGLAFVAIAKNEAPYIEEWINFHVKQGVSHFFIYDNDSTDNLYDVLKPYIRSGIVTYHKIRGIGRQMDAYNIAFSRYRRRFKYMGCIDCDEFVFVRKPLGGGDYSLYKFVDEFMSEHKDAGGIGINWLIFGSSGHETKPEGGVLENYTMCAEKNFSPNHLTKVICDPFKVLSWVTPHCPAFRLGFYCLDENGKRDGNITEEVNFDKIRINHYFSKSKEEYINIKISRGMVFFNDNRKRTMQEFYAHDRNECKDTEILSRL